MRNITALEFKIVDKAITKYSDIDMPVNSCIEKFLRDDIKLDPDFAFDQS